MRNQNVRQFKIELNKELHKEFKIACLNNDVSMTQVIGDFITEYLKRIKRVS